MIDRNGPSTGTKRDSRSLQHLKNVQLNGSAPSRSNDNVFTSLRATQLLGSQRAALPAELIAMILEYLPVPDLMRFARTSRRLQEMVYDDTRWIQKLKSMGAWNDIEARQRFDEGMKRKSEAQKPRGGHDLGANGTEVVTRRHAGSVTLFDAGVEEQRMRQSTETTTTSSHRKRKSLAHGFEDLSISASTASNGISSNVDQNVALSVFAKVRSIRGFARQEFGKIYAALAPFYLDLSKSRTHADAMIFRTYRDPEQQAQILSNLKRFSRCDHYQGAFAREAKLDGMMGVFENAVLREFEQGYAASDIDGRMHRYANVLVTLNGGSSGMDAYISSHPIMTGAMRLGNPLDCLAGVATGHVDLNPSQSFFERLASIMVDQAAIVDRVFPSNKDILTPFLQRICDSIIADYLTTLYDEAHSQGIDTYVKAVAGTFAQALRFVASIVSSKASPKDFPASAKKMVMRCFERHIDLYLAEELSLFKQKSEAMVAQWEKDFSEMQASTESFFMSNISRQAAKRDFLSSFKKVVMMPVNVLPAFPISSPFASAKSTATNKPLTNLESIDTAYVSARPASPALTAPGFGNARSSTPAQEAPTTELAAKAAIMNSRLEGIKTLFSIDVALSLTQLAKASIERAALMVHMGGDIEKQTKEQCSAIFVVMLDVLGNKHIRHGFDKAVDHLGSYNPQEVRKFRENTSSTDRASTPQPQTGVEPLVTFLELVNVGDLIQQMIDVFFSQELVSTRLIDRDDFLDRSVGEKKKFEQMLDERVAAGLNKGIDVLMDEVDFIFATLQLPTDFNPTITSPSQPLDITPTPTAHRIVDTISGHTSMLHGSTDKNTLDVFTQEVGLRLFGALCKHFKRQRVSVDGAVRLISDINHYAAFVARLKQKPLAPYYQALREMAQIYLVYIEPPVRGVFAGSGAGSGAVVGKRGSLLGGRTTATQVQAKELATIVADTQRYHGIFPAEEVYEFAERRADWYLVKSDVERAMYGVGCVVM